MPSGQMDLGAAAGLACSPGAVTGVESGWASGLRSGLAEAERVRRARRRGRVRGRAAPLRRQRVHSMAGAGDGGLASAGCVVGIW